MKTTQKNTTAGALVELGNINKVHQTRARARVLLAAGIITAAESVAALASADAIAARARASANLAQLARIKDIADNGGDGAEWMEIDGARRLVVHSLPVEQTSAPRGAGKGGGSDAFDPAAVRARAGRVLSEGLAGRAMARAARISHGSARRWLKKNSRREALAVGEVGAGAGVDDLQAGRDWSAELLGVSREVHFKAASYGVAIVSAPLPACAALVARGLSGGLSSDMRAATIGRGRRIDGAPVVEWADKGRQVAAESIGIIGRGVVWIWAARAAGHAMHSARYGLGGRDGREVGAGWRASGSVDVPRVWAAAAASRRPSFVAAARAALAREVMAARAALHDAVWSAAQAVTPAQRMAAGSSVGAARERLTSTRARARVLGAAVAGRPAPDGLGAWVMADGSAMTAAGRKLVSRVKSTLGAAVRDELARVTLPRAMHGAGVTPGDELANPNTVAAYSSR